MAFARFQGRLSPSFLLEIEATRPMSITRLVQNSTNSDSIPSISTMRGSVDRKCTNTLSMSSFFFNSPPAFRSQVLENDKRTYTSLVDSTKTSGETGHDLVADWRKSNGRWLSMNGTDPTRVTIPPDSSYKRSGDICPIPRPTRSYSNIHHTTSSGFRTSEDAYRNLGCFSSRRCLLPICELNCDGRKSSTGILVIHSLNQGVWLADNDEYDHPRPRSVNNSNFSQCLTAYSVGLVAAERGSNIVHEGCSAIFPLRQSWNAKASLEDLMLSLLSSGTNGSYSWDDDL
ncbi:hypothetical protein DL96DRAFT_1680716 [Flagelloscypha sp. PMI_526]|nr:hypothetical protein DL96DRAFT_1680716 [Flagelloscypha sp. PMI_526]